MICRLRLFAPLRATLRWLLERARTRFAVLGSTAPDWHEPEAEKTDQYESAVAAYSQDTSPYLKEDQSADDRLVPNLFGLEADDSVRRTVRAIFRPRHDHLGIQPLSDSNCSHIRSLVDWIFDGS